MASLFDHLKLRQIKTGPVNGKFVEVTGNPQPAERIVPRGSLFTERAAE
jgi:hypothetical protein